MKILYAVVAVLLGGASAFAASSATQTITFSVTAINEISVSGDPASLAVSSSVAGSAPNSASDRTTAYAITTNESGRKITAVVDSPIPVGVTLAINLAAPIGAISTGTVVLGTTAADVVTGIAGVNETANEITYVLSATAEAGVVTSQSRTITLTITAE